MHYRSTDCDSGLPGPSVALKHVTRLSLTVQSIHNAIRCAGICGSQQKLHDKNDYFDSE